MTIYGSYIPVPVPVLVICSPKINNIELSSIHYAEYESDIHYISNLFTLTVFTLIIGINLHQSIKMEELRNYEISDFWN
jgi:hypothetical protein